MTKLIWGLLSSILLLFIVWLCVCYAQYGSDMINKHINLVETFNRMFNVPQPNINVFQDSVRQFQENFSKVGDYTTEFMEWANQDWGAFEWVKMIFSGIQYIAQAVYFIYNIVNFLMTLLSSLITYVSYACTLILNIIITLFNPVFY